MIDVALNDGHRLLEQSVRERAVREGLSCIRALGRQPRFDPGR